MTKCKIHGTYASYNVEGLTARFCAKCKTEDMVDVVHKRCHCRKSQPTFNYKGLKAKYCVECKTDDMIDVGNKKCIHKKQYCWDCYPLELLKHSQRMRIRHFFPKHPNPDELLGTDDYQIVYNHIKSQLTDDMTYENYGKGSDQWSLDHILPIMYNDPNVQQIKNRLHYTNIQPTFNNNSKHNTLRQEDIEHLVKHYNSLSNELKNDLTLIDNFYAPVEEPKKKMKLILKKNLVIRK